MTNSLVPKPFDITDAKRAREEAARLAERRDGAAWSGVGVVAGAVASETVAREELATQTEAEAAAIRQQVVDEALAAAEKFIDVNRTLDALDVKYDGVITNAGQIGAKLTKAEADLVAHNSRLTANDTAITTLTGTTLPALQNSLDVAKAELAPLPGKIADNATKLTAAQGQLTTLKDATIPALAADLVAAKGRLATAEVTLSPLPEKLATAQADLTSAFGQLSTVDARVDAAKTAAATDATAKANQAKVDATAAAALVAQAKADTAKAEALTAAATDAKTKADAAQAAAVAAAKTATDLAAAGAKSEAIAAATLDAKAKADAAQAAAVTAAATAADSKVATAKAATLTEAATAAQTKADKALADAKLDASTKAAQALTDAKADAKLKADAAQAAAITAAKADAKLQSEAAEARAAATAALDAKAKADAAQAASLAAAKTYADAQASGAGTDALAAAKADATAKANAAQAAAISAAALDATAKKEQAEATAAADAKSKADAALAAAKLDATAKADAAREAAKGSSLIFDGGFESGKNSAFNANTTNREIVNDPVEAHSGKWYFRMRRLSEAYPGAQFSLSVTQNHTYRTTFWARVPATAPGPQNLHVRLNLKNAAGGNAWPSVGLSIPNDGAWREYVWDAPVTPPRVAGDTTLWIQALGTQFNEEAWIYIDDVAVADVTDLAKAEAELLAIPVKIEAAKQAAIDAAALVAEAKATAAQSAATTAAAADAKSKADAAQAAAIVAAKTATDLAASGAQQGAIDAAKADATSKANAAQMAAVNAAAADATAKANQAKTDAITAAANDSTTKANNAKADAVTAAATDATAKANQAKTDAVASATTMTNGIGKNLSSTAVPTVTNAAPQGSVWRRTDASGRVIGVWEQTAAGVGSTWTPRLIASEVMDNLDVGKLSSSAATINNAVIAKMSAQIATVIELNADRISAGLIGAAQIDTQSLAVAIATIIKLNAGSITSGTIDTERLNVTTLAASIATIIKLNASAITAGTIDTARLNVTTLAATLATILSLNADRITAGTINTARLNVVAIAAATAAFQTVDIKNLFASTGTLDEAVIAKLWTDVVNSKKITTQMLAVGAFDNILPDPDFTNTNNEWGAAGGIYSFSATEGYLGAGAFKIAPNASQSGRYSTRIPSAGTAASYRVTVWAKADTAVPAAGLSIYTNRKIISTGAAINPSQWLKQSNGAGGNDPIPANTWVKLSAVISIPEATYDFAVGFYTQPVFSGGTVWFSQPSVTRMNGGELTVDGTVTAQALESELVLATKIVAGDPASTHAEMSPLGFKVFASPAGGGAPTEVVRLGVAATDDFFAVTRGDGSLSATISQGGIISGEQVWADKFLVYRGEELATLLENRSGGIIGWAQRTTAATQNANNSQRFPYLRVKVNVQAGRAYRVSTTPIQANASDASTAASLRLVYALGADALPFDNTLNIVATSAEGSGGTWQAPTTMNGLVYANTTTTLSVMIAFGAIGPGTVGLQASSSAPIAIIIEDMGPQVPQTGEYMNGTATPPPSVRNYYKEYQLTGASSYQGNGAYYAFSENKMFQGQSPAGVGNLTSIACFQSMTADLAGATITGMRVYLYFDFWYYNAGGTAYLGLHGHANPPSTFSHSVSGFVASSGWPRPGGRWVNIPSSYWAGFKSGAYKGISLQAPNGMEYYGYASENAVISASYTK